MKQGGGTVRHSHAHDRSAPSYGTWCDEASLPEVPESPRCCQESQRLSLWPVVRGSRPPSSEDPSSDEDNTPHKVASAARSRSPLLIQSAINSPGREAIEALAKDYWQ